LNLIEKWNPAKFRD
jgi:hypothetical protein